LIAFEELRFKDFITLQRGFDLPKKKRTTGEYPVIGSTSVDGYHNEFKVKKPGVVTGRSGSLGEALYVSKDFWPLNTTLWVRDFKGNNPKFVYYFLKTMDLARYNAGVGVPTLNRNHLDNIQVRIPERENQDKIVDTLSCLDDLAELDLRRIGILEELAKNLHNEWFVHLRYPRNKTIKIAEPKNGRMPTTRKLQKLSDVCSLITDGTHDTPKPVEEGYFLVMGKNIKNGFIDFSGCYKISKEDHKKVIQRSKPEKGDILFTNIGTLGNTALVDQNFEFSIKNVALLKPLKPFYSTFLFLQLSSKMGSESLLQRSSGTSQRFLGLAMLRNSSLIFPADETLLEFDRIMSPIFLLRSILWERIQATREIRDLLLPKLLSGEIDVNDVSPSD
jgi:type I restriction enzyme S subunit